MPEKPSEPRCPKCESLLAEGKTGNAACMMFCPNTECQKSCTFEVFGDTEADCIRQATTLKLVDRLVREEREACMSLVRKHCSLCRGTGVITIVDGRNFRQQGCECEDQLDAIRLRKQPTKGKS